MQSTIYIRKENEERWKSIKDKSGWVNEQLRGPVRGSDVEGIPEELSGKSASIIADDGVKYTDAEEVL